MDKQLLKTIAEEIHKPARKKFERRKVISFNVDDIWGVDLVDMRSLKRYNDDFSYLVTIIDIYSRYAFAFPIKNKTGNTLVNVFEKIFEKYKRKPKKLWVDRGSEFYNRQFLDFLKDNNIKIYSTYGEHKSAVIERFNRTLKTIMYKWFTRNNTKRWNDIIFKLIDRYNNHYHSTIDMKPIQALKPKNKSYIDKLMFQIYPKEHKEPKYKVNDNVRISRTKGTFEKGYTPNWTYEIFTIYKINNTNPVTYKLKDYNGEIIEGSFYEQELQKTKQKEVYLIEKVLKTKKVGNKKQYLVKWLGYPEKFNSWVDEKDMHNILK